MSETNPDEAIFEHLTNEAMQAAIQGKWDSVAQFYDRRANAGSLEALSRDVTKKIMKSDEWIITRIRDVQSLIQDQIGDAQQQRRRLDGLKRQWGSQSPVQTSHRLSV